MGVAFGFWLRSASAKAEKAQLAQRALELGAELAAERERLRAESQARTDTDRTQSASISRLEAELKACLLYTSLSIGLFRSRTTPIFAHVASLNSKLRLSLTPTEILRQFATLFLKCSGTWV